MSNDVVNALLGKLDWITLYVDFPKVFEQLRGQDANFEIVQSNTLQPIRLFYVAVVAIALGIVFIHTHVKLPITPEVI